MSFKYLEDDATADLAFTAKARSLELVFEETAKALINAMVNPVTVDEQEVKLVQVKGEDLKSLLYDFLEEVLFFHDAEGVVFKTVQVKELNESGYSLKAVLKGEKFNLEKHEARSNVKAITYYDMKIEKTREGYETKVTVDL